VFFYFFSAPFDGDEHPFLFFSFGVSGEDDLLVLVGVECEGVLLLGLAFPPLLGEGNGFFFFVISKDFLCTVLQKLRGAVDFQW